LISFVEQSITPDFLALITVVSNLGRVEVQLGFQHNLLLLVAQLNDNILVRVLDIEHDCFIPNGLGSDAHICFGIRVVLVDLDMVGTFFEILGVYDVDFKLGVTADAHISHEMNLSQFSLLKLLFNFFFLPSMINYILHDFFLPLQQFIAGVNVLQDELVPMSRKKG